MAYLLDPAEGKYRLEDLTLRYLSMEIESPDAEAGTLDFDADAATERHRPARRRRPPSRRTRSPTRSTRASSPTSTKRFERPLVRVLAKMEHAGIRVDRAFLDDLRAELAKECDTLVREIHGIAGEEFNVNSTPQLPGRALREARASRRSRRRRPGRPPTPTRCRRWRRTTRSSTSCCATARSRSCVPPTRTRSRRSSGPTAACTRPSSRRTPRPGASRARRRTCRTSRCAPPTAASSASAFIADDGCGLLTADYSQIELRVLAHLAEDPGLIDAFERGLDVHTVTAAKVFGVAGDRGRLAAAPVREGRQLRPRVRHGGVRARAAPRHPDRRGARDPRQLLRRLPERARVHGQYGEGGEAARLHDHDLRAASPDHRALVRQLPHPPDGGAHGAERARAGFGRRRVQARDDRRRPCARRRRLPDPHAAHRARRARASRCRSRSGPTSSRSSARRWRA